MPILTYNLLGWKLSPVAFYHQLRLWNTTWLSFQPNTTYNSCKRKKDGLTFDLLERRLRLVAGSLVGDVTTATEGEDVVAVEFDVDWAMVGTISWSCEPAPNWLVSGSDRQSPSSLDTSMAGSSVSICVRLLDRPYSHDKMKRLSFMVALLSNLIISPSLPLLLSGQIFCLC